MDNRFCCQKKIENKQKFEQILLLERSVKLAVQNANFYKISITYKIGLSTIEPHFSIILKKKKQHYYFISIFINDNIMKDINIKYIFLKDVL